MRKKGGMLSMEGEGGGKFSEVEKTHIRSSVAPDVRRPRPIKMTPLPPEKQTRLTYTFHGALFINPVSANVPMCVLHAPPSNDAAPSRRPSRTLTTER